MLGFLLTELSLKLGEVLFKLNNLFIVAIISCHGFISYSLLVSEVLSSYFVHNLAEFVVFIIVYLVDIILIYRTFLLDFHHLSFNRRAVSN